MLKIVNSSSLLAAASSNQLLSNNFKSVEAWVEYLARSSLSTVLEHPTKLQSDSPLCSYTAGVHHMRLALQELSTISLGSIKSFSMNAKLERDLESAQQKVQQQASILSDLESAKKEIQQLASVLPDLESARREIQQLASVLQEKDELIKQKEEALQDSLQAEELLKEALKEKDETFVAEQKKHAEKVKSVELKTILKFVTSHLADD